LNEWPGPAVRTNTPVRQAKLDRGRVARPCAAALKVKDPTKKPVYAAAAGDEDSKWDPAAAAEEPLGKAVQADLNNFTFSAPETQRL
jgi:hypothetical protein